MQSRVLAVLAVAVLAACGGGSPDHASERGTRAEASKGDILIGAAAPFTGDLAQFGESMRNGIDLAVEEINAAGGILGGRKLRIEAGDDQAKPSEGTLVAQRFAGNLDMVAVVGHFNSGVSIPASDIYEKLGLLQITPASTNPKLTSRGLRLIFRNLPNDDENGRQLADFASRKGFKRVAIYFANNAYGKGLADVFEKRAKENGIEIVDRQAYDPERDEDFRAVLTKWKGAAGAGGAAAAANAALDAICIAGENPKGAIIISQAREVGLKTPFLGGDGIASPELWEIGGSAAEGTFVTSYFHPGDPRPEVAKFNEAFQAKYGRLPDVWAAQAYDAVKILAAAMTAANSPAPVKVAAALRTLKDWVGVTGVHAFDQNGDVVGKKVIVTVVKNGAFALYEDQASTVPDAD
jgi:branched-chain amino acid transport system substrate-binding protein